MSEEKPPEKCEVVSLEKYRNNRESSENEVLTLDNEPPGKKQTRKRVRNLLEGGRFPRVDEYIYGENKVLTIGLTDRNSFNTMDFLENTFRKDRKQPHAIITEAMSEEEDLTEVRYVKEIMKSRGVPTDEWIISAYNQIVAEYANVKIKDAAKAIMLANASRYCTEPDLGRKIANIGLGLGDEEIMSIEGEIMNGKNWEKNTRNAIENFSKMIEAANDINWHLFQEFLREAKELGVRGKSFAIVCGIEYAQAFNHDFKPSRIYTNYDLATIIEEIEEIKLLRMKREEEEAERDLNEVAQAEKEFHREWRTLKEELKNNPKNELAKQALKNLLVPQYRELMRRGNFDEALELAQSMQKHGIKCADELIRRSKTLIEEWKR